MGTALVIENDPTDDARRLGDWLTEAGLDLHVRSRTRATPLPDDLTGYAALVVLGGDQHAYPAADGTPGAPWFPALEGLLRKAVRNRVPTLGICLGAQLLATAHAGTVERSPSGPEIGPALVGKRDAADQDPLFEWVPLLPDVLQWHHDEITELPLGAVLLAASTHYPHQAFRHRRPRLGPAVPHRVRHRDDRRLGDRTRRRWPSWGYDPDVVVAACDAVMADVEEVWQPFAARFAALALGRARRRRAAPQSAAAGPLTR